MSDTRRDSPVPDEPYLWDRSGPVDPEIARLEALLSPLAHRAPLRTPRRSRRPAFLAATAVVLAIAAAWLIFARPPTRIVSAPPLPLPQEIARSCAQKTPGSYAFRSEGGPVRCGEGQHASGWMAIDEVLETNDAKATLEVATLGTLALDPGTKLRLLPANDDVQTLDLLRGTVRAHINAAQRRFVVKTPAADAVDLGCDYTLTVDERGRGLLSVSYGSVSLEKEGRAPTLVTEGASCPIGAHGPGTPLADGAIPALREAATDLDLGKADAFDRVLAASTARDTLTLWHVMRRISPEERGRAYDRLVTFVPPPKDAPREAIVRGERAAIVAYRDVLVPRWFGGRK